MSLLSSCVIGFSEILRSIKHDKIYIIYHKHEIFELIQLKLGEKINMGAKCCKPEESNPYDNYQRRKSSVLPVPMPVMPHSSYTGHHRDPDPSVNSSNNNITSSDHH